VRCTHPTVTQGKNGMKTKIALLIVCLVLIAWTVDAQEKEKVSDSRRALAEELLKQMDMPGTLERSFAMIKKMIPLQMKKMQESAAAEAENGVAKAKIMAKMEKSQAKVIDLVETELSWDKLKDEYIAIYAETYTEEELKGAIEFYKSPVGHSFITKQPELMKRSMELSQQRVMKLIPKIQAMAKESMEGTEKESKKDDSGLLKAPKNLAPKKIAPAKETP
jgi:hypothetical protein